MKKALLSIFIIVICFNSFAQPIINRSGVGQTVQDARWMAQYNAFLPRYDDTTSANLSKGIDSCGALIYCRDVAAIFFRACTGYSSRVWIQIQPAGSASGQNPWLIGGNLGLFTSPYDPQSIGLKTYQGLRFLTNNIPRLYLAKDGIASETGTTIGLGYDPSDSNRLTTFSGGVVVSDSAWSLTGNASTVAGTNFIGTTDSVDWVIKTNNTERARVKANGFFGIGVSTPLYPLSVKGLTSTAANYGIVQTDASDRVVAEFDNNGRMDLFNHNALEGAVAVLYNTANGANGTPAGHFAWGAKNNANNLQTIGTLYSYVTDATAANMSSDIRIAYMDNAVTGSNTQPNKEITISSSGFVLPGIPINSQNTSGTSGASWNMVNNGGKVLSGTSYGSSFGYAPFVNAGVIENTGDNLFISQYPNTGDINFATTNSRLSRLIIKSDGSIEAPYLTSGVGTKALRYNPGTGLVTYADTTTSSAPSLTATYIGYGDGSNLLTGTSGFTYDVAATTGSGLSLSSSAITSGALATFTNTGTAAASNTKRVAEFITSGANTNASQTVTAVKISNTNTGTTNTNVGLNVTASGATNNYAALFTGNVGIGTSAPTQPLHVLGTATAAASMAARFVGGTSNAAGGFYIGAYSSTYGGLWSGNITPSTANYALISTGASTSVNSTSNLDFSISDGVAWRVNSLKHFVAPTDNTYDIGATGATRPRTGYFGTSIVSPKHEVATSVFWSSGTGSPEGVLTANIGSLYSRTDGGAGTSLYVKESGTGNTGWVAK